MTQPKRFPNVLRLSILVLASKVATAVFVSGALFLEVSPALTSELEQCAILLLMLLVLLLSLKALEAQYTTLMLVRRLQLSSNCSLFSTAAFGPVFVCHCYYCRCSSFPPALPLLSQKIDHQRK